MIDQVRSRLGHRQLIWVGTRGDDSRSLSDVPEFSASYSLQGSMESRPSVSSFALEELTGVREDLDTYDIDDHLRTPEVAEFRRRVLRAASMPSAIIGYRPSTFLSAIGFSKSGNCLMLGMFRGHQAAFEHKPWMENSIAELGIPRVPWRYIADVEQFATSRLFDTGPIMLRRSRSTGGVGMIRLDDASQVQEKWDYQDEAFLSVAPFIEGGIPVNVGGVVWHDGVTLHPVSIQLIGIENCTTREFGYCGNDFASASGLGQDTLGSIEQSMRRIGALLKERGFLGAFGVDFLVKDGTPLFLEVNPRFQGSTHASCQISVEMNESCILIEHTAAFLGIDAPPSLSLSDFPTGLDSLSHLVIHNTSDASVRSDPSTLIRRCRHLPMFCRADVLTSTSLQTRPSGVLMRVTLRGGVTQNGFAISSPWQDFLGDVTPSQSAAQFPDKNGRRQSNAAQDRERPNLKESCPW